MVADVSEPFQVRVKIRGYELDTQGHLNWAEYLHYAENARWECMAAAGISQDKLLASGVGPAALDVHIDFKRELRGGDEVDVSCEFRWTGRKFFEVVQDLTRADGTLAAKVTSKTGLLDLRERHLITDPAKHLRELATAPEIMGL
jgi:acyl-CoA thioester hydrolase